MEILFMVFMIFVCVTCLFSVLVVLRDIVKEIMQAKREKAQAKACVVEEKAEKPAVKEVKVEEKPQQDKAEKAEKAEEAVAATAVENEAETNDGKISFSANGKQTHEEKYAQLSKKDKARYDEITAYAARAEGNRRFINERYEEYKVGKNRLVRMLIKRGIIVCEFILQNSDFKNYVNENKILVKQAATQLKIVDEQSVAFAKSSIDIAINAINEEKEYKKQLAREKRRERNKNKAK